MKTNEKDTKQRVVPALRFPEFHGSKGWDLKPLSAYLTEYRQKSDGKSKVHSVSLSKGIVNQKEYLGRSFSADDTSHYKLVKPYDIVYTKSPTGDFPYGIVKQNFNPYNVIVSPLYGVFTPNNQYIGYIIHSIFESAIRLNNYLSPLIQKGAKNTIQISNDTFISKEILLPDNEDEQRKIADCLSSIDALIKAAENKIDELKAHKKGLMQQLFPAEGETVPDLRFPEFQNAGEWKQTTIGAICRISNGKSNVQDNVQNGEYPLFDRSETVKASNKFLFDCEAIIIPGEGRFIPKHYIGRFDLHQRAYALKDFTCHALFVYYYITAFSFILTQKAVRSTVLSLRMPILEAFPLLLPNNIQEQQKIADCLSSVDDLIAVQTNHLEALRNHKKGLMQQLFPNVNNREE
ncbi:restriction endonuclease subunit S [uncultured Alistipes sp.]|uniref:restriction endonuclease subunit S n=1 Tax=uncultured Alistipes sp. TaxID=538949 RepID=UPI00272B5DAD|nr:restriction endonuclease subunit S [uncultured Alistipes sp.]